jgi:EAL domain-containing protein (putative c-di-GMP-specific phosphodiesterase class I)
MKTAFLDDVLHHDLLEAVFQPIVATDSMEIVGFEGLIRGPANSTLESPLELFAAACASGRQLELEQRCVQTVWTRFLGLRLPGKLFLNVSAAMLLAPKSRQKSLLNRLAELRFDARRVVIEITEEQAVSDFRRLRRRGRLLSRHGCALAIDDLGAGFASLRLWLELQPAFVKIDILFVRGVDRDPIKQAFLRSIRDVALACGTRVIAEGIETAPELACVREIGIDCGQGFHIGRPSAHPGFAQQLLPC